MPYETNTSVETLADALRGATRVLVTTHQKPDGDAMGSVLAVVRACRAIGVRAEGWMVGPCEGNLRLFTGDDAVAVVDPRNPRLPDGDFDLAVVVDTGAWTQLEILAPWLRAMSDRVIGLDHHARGDAVAARRVVDVACGSCTALLIRLVDALKVDLAFGADARGRYSVAEALYLGLATDTGWFRFPNARAAEFALASRLLAAGVDKDAMYQQIEQSSRAGRVRLQGRALSSLEFVAGGAISIMRLHAVDFTETGAEMEESSGVVNMPMEVAAVRASVLAVEDAANGVIKLSFRSKPAGPDGAFVDVNELAARFGGGGHVHAAGAKQKGTIDEVVARVRAAVEI
ncbi:MAG: DHH family phosphoesterase [bacterium]|jgi:phosphoesterase RecJ-like protein